MEASRDSRAVFAATFLLLGAARRGAVLPTGSQFVGQLILGWGIFNLVEGLINHHLLGIHHVRDMPVHMPVYDWMFLGIGGVLFIAIGWFLSRSGRGHVARVERG